MQNHLNKNSDIDISMVFFVHNFYGFSIVPLSFSTLSKSTVRKNIMFWIFKKTLIPIIPRDLKGQDIER